METKQPYTVHATTGADRHVSANIRAFVAPNDIIDAHLIFSDVGIKRRPGVDLSTIPHEVFDSAWQRVNVNLDRDRWQIADLSIMHKARFDEGDCVRAMAAVGLYRTISTAATWASWAANIPIEVRVPAQLEDGTNTKMSIYWHKHVAPLPVDAQRELLQACLVNNLSGNERWTEERFGEICYAWRNDNGIKIPQQRLVNRPARDVIFEATMELGAAEVARDKAVEMSQGLAKTVTATDAALWQFRLRVLGALLG